MSAASPPPPTSSRLPPGAEHRSPVPRPPNDNTFPFPRLTIHLHDLNHPGTTRAINFFSTHSSVAFLKTAITSVCTHLYISPSSRPQPPNVKSLDLHIRPLPGVAYTTGNHHEKEIHLSSDYIASLPDSRVADEITGVIRHEMVHVYQNNGRGTAPGGLIEGIADWVRLHDGLGPPHWKRGGGKWDDGYQNTAYFLTWVEERLDTARGLVVKMNKRLGEDEWNDKLWRELTGLSVLDLWAMYCAEFGIEDGVAREENPPLPPRRHRREEDMTNGDGTVEGHNEPSTSISVDESVPKGEFTSALAEVCRTRLSNIRFSGRTNGQRFIREFEGLLERALPDAGPEERRLLLVTSLHDVAGDWYEETDLDDNMPYEDLKKAMIKSFPGKSLRSHKLIERVAVID